MSLRKATSIFSSTSEDESPPMLTRRLYECAVEVGEARDLTLKGKPYKGEVVCVVRLDYAQCAPQSTRNPARGPAPRWGETFNFAPECIGNTVEVVVLAKDKMRSPALGKALIPLINCSKQAEWLALEGGEGGGAVQVKVGLRRLVKKQLLLHYNFEEDFNLIGRVIDRSGSNNDARLKNLDSADVSRGPGVHQSTQAIVFSGFNYIEARFNPTKGCREFSLSLWFRARSFEEDFVLITTAREDVAAKDKHAERRAGSGWRVSRRCVEMWDMRGRPMVPEPVEHAALFEEEIWNHLVVIYSGTRLYEYINGSLVVDTPTLHGPLGTGRSPQIGACDDTMDFTGFAGAMDDIRMYDYVLKEDQVRELYQWGAGVLF